MHAVTRILPASPTAIWQAMIDVRCWPEWGPSVTDARIDGGGHLLHQDASGRVRTAVGLWLPFQVDQWDEGHSWSWSVASVSATAHRVWAIPGTALTASASIDVPTWAIFYGPLCWVALGRLSRVAAGPERASV